MPALIDHIDAIARKKGRDVLYVEFHPESRSEARHYRYEDDLMRASVLAWLDANGIGWEACGEYARPGQMWPYLGQVYLDVVFNEGLPEYRKLRDYLELPDGTMRHAGVRFYALPLDYANKNAAHDEPGFWENWAENF